MIIETESSEVYLLRHGETTWNVQGRLQGQSNESELTEKGKEEVRLVADQFRSMLCGKPVVIWSSDLTRAHATAQIVAKALGLPEESVQLDADLREANFGQFEGVQIGSGKAHPNFLHYKAHPFLHALDPEHGESYQQVALRAEAAVRRIMETSPGTTVLIVTHGGVLRSLQMQALPEGSDPANFRNIPNAANGEVFKLNPVTKGLVKVAMAALLWMTPVSAENPTLPQAAQEVLQEVLKNQPIKSVELLKGGFSGAQLYKVDTETDSYVLRVMDAHRQLSDREREITCLTIAAKEAIAPQVYYANAQRGIILMEYIPHQSIAGNNSCPLPQLAHILKKLHDGSPFPPGLSGIQNIFYSVSQRADKGMALPPLAQEALAHLKPLEDPLQKTAILAPCHNDLNPNNVLVAKNGIKLIDWEVAGMNDPYFDVATAALFFTFDPKQEELFLRSYFGATPTPLQLNRLYVMKQVALCFYGIALLNTSLGEQTPPLSASEIEALPSFLDFILATGTGQERIDSPSYPTRLAFAALKQAVHEMQSEQFREAVKHIGS